MPNDKELEQHGRGVKGVGHPTADEWAFDGGLSFVVHGVEAGVERLQRVGCQGVAGRGGQSRLY
jgi:hypothetical protein